MSRPAALSLCAVVVVVAFLAATEASPLPAPAPVRTLPKTMLLGTADKSADGGQGPARRPGPR